MPKENETFDTNLRVRISRDELKRLKKLVGKVDFSKWVRETLCKAAKRKAAK